MLQRTVSSRDIQAAGGLEAWMRTAGKKGTVQKPQPKSAGSSLTAKGRKPADPTIGYAASRMNKLEARYANWLEVAKRSGEIVSWKFEAVTLRLAERTTYTPDFYVMLPDGSVGFHETKGFWRDDARAKIKIAAEMFPELFFVGVQWDSKAKEWRFERFGKGGTK